MFLENLCTKVAFTLNNVAVLTDVDFNYLKEGGNGAFAGIKNLVMSYLAESYQLLIAVGALVLVIAASVAAFCFGFFKHSQKVIENKEWLIRLIVVLGIIGAIPTFAGAAYAIGQSVESAMEEETTTSSIDDLLPYNVKMDC